jgi:hypothetical protein
MATCAAIGQAVGTAAALGVRAGLAPSELASRPSFVEGLQQRLLRDDCFIPGVRAADRRDLAQRARATASSQVCCGPPAAVLSGETRAVWGAGGVRPDLAARGAHRWMSDPQQGFPAWIQLEWDRPVSVTEVRIVLDTGQHRVLTLSHDDEYTARMVWGPQPETVSRYRLLCSDGGDAWRELAGERENYQRLRVHRFEPVSLRRLRLVAEAAWGLDHARVLELRCYPAEA